MPQTLVIKFADINPAPLNVMWVMRRDYKYKIQLSATQICIFYYLLLLLWVSLTS